MRAQHRGMFVRQPRKLLGLSRARPDAELVQPAQLTLPALPIRPALPALPALPARSAVGPGGGLPPQRLKQRRIVGDVSVQRRDLIEHLVRDMRHSAGHRTSPSPFSRIFPPDRVRGAPPYPSPPWLNRGGKHTLPAGLACGCTLE